MKKELPNDQTPPSVEQQLSAILDYLHRMERRDRVRMTGSTIRSLLALIPLAITLYFAWYFYTHGDDLMQTIMDRTIERSMNMFGG